MFRLEADGPTYWLNVGERQVVLTREENCRIIMGEGGNSKISNAGRRTKSRLSRWRDASGAGRGR